MTTTHELLRQAREALGRMEAAFDWFVGRSGFTQTEHLKGLEHSSRVRAEAYAAHDAVRTTIANIDAHLSAQPTPAQPAGELTKKLKHPLYWFNQSTGEMLAGDYVSVHGPLPERDSTWIALDERAAGEPAALQAAAQPLFLAKTRDGKQHDTGRVTYADGGFFADTASPEDARRIADALNRAATPTWPSGLLDRVKSAEQRIRDNHAPRRIPADPTDVDLVLAEVRMLIEGKAPPFWLTTTRQDVQEQSPRPQSGTDGEGAA